MKYTRHYFLLFVIAAVIIILSACRKDPTKVGFDIQPPSDDIELYGNDTIILFASYTVEHDSVSTSSMSTLVLGSMNDPVFGSTQAAFNTQFRLSKTNPYFGKNVTFDSICLQLAYSGRWGDSSTWMTAHVYRLTDSLSLNSDTTLGVTRDNYFATDIVEYDRVPLGSKTFLDQPFDSVEMKRFWLKYTAAMHAPFLSIRLDDEFGKELLSDSSLFVSNSDFLSKYYGLRVDVDPVAGSFGKMLYFGTASPETKLVLYYTNSDSSANYSFVINDGCIRFNNYEIDHSTADADLQNQLNNSFPTSTLGDQRLYLQPLNGVRIKVNFEGIETLREKWQNGNKFVINEAKLFLNNAEPYDKNLPPSPQLTTYTVDATGKIIMTPDSELGATYMGGAFNSGKNRYEMRITRYLQKRILDPSMDNDNLYISISGASFVANRVVLYGNNPDDEKDMKAKVRILMTEY
ncbi:MAG: DUF4270 domain-containing protein [Bacteroidales bacterium]|nr:DUF4270 domain-containing protein [Bacteroidales bacterium]